MSQPDSFPPANRPAQSPAAPLSRNAQFRPVGTSAPSAASAPERTEVRTGATSPAAAQGAAPAAGAPAGAPRTKTIAGPRRVRLALTHVDPWSVMKVAFLLSVAAGIILVVASGVVWFMLDAMHVFSKIQELVGSVFSSTSNSFTAMLEYMKFSRAISMATVIAVVNVILSTALATIGAFLYNVTAALVGGVHLTLADE